MGRLRIKVKLLTKKNGEIKSIVIKDVVKKIGRSGYVALPIELVNKYVEIEVKVLK